MRSTRLLALAAAGLISHSASAATIVLDVTGSVSSGTSASVEFAGFRFGFFSIALDGLTPLTIRVGDEVRANIVLDQSLTFDTVQSNFVVDSLSDATIDVDLAPGAACNALCPSRSPRMPKPTSSIHVVTYV